MSALSQEHHLSPSEYLRLEREVDFKSHYLNGLLVAMAGGRYRHNVIASNINGLLFGAFRKRPCVTLGPDMKIWIEAANSFRYAGVSAACGPLDFYDEVEDAYTNPQLIVEVLSPNTERIDRIDKFAQYKLLPSFSEYLLVSQARPEIERHRKSGDGRWTSEVYEGLDATISLESVSVELSASEVFEKIAFD